MNRIKKHTFEAVSLLTADNGLLEVTIIPAVDQPDWLIPSNLILDVIECHERLWTYMWQNQEVAVFHLTPKEIKPATLIILEGNTDVHRVALQTIAVRELHRMQVRISNVKDTTLPEEYLSIKSAPVITNVPTESTDIIDDVNSGNSDNDNISYDDSMSHNVNNSDDSHADFDMIDDDMSVDDINSDDEITDNDVINSHINDNENKNSDNNDENYTEDNTISNDDGNDSQSTESNEDSSQNSVTSVIDNKINENSFDEHLVESYTFQYVDVNGDVYVVPDLDKIAHHLVDLDD